MDEPSIESNQKNRAKVLLIDDHPIVRQGLTQLINATMDLVVCDEASRARDALQILKSITPDIVIVDISLEDRNGVALIKDILACHPTMPCLALSMYDESMYALRVLRAGGRGYIMKQEKPKTILHAIRHVLSGHVYLSENFATRLLDDLVTPASGASLPEPDGLTTRELEVLTLLGRGYGSKEIAEKLSLSVKTVEAHRDRIKKKTKLKNSSELIRYAIQSIVDGDLPSDS